MNYTKLTRGTSSYASRKVVAAKNPKNNRWYVGPNTPITLSISQTGKPIYHFDNLNMMPAHTTFNGAVIKAIKDHGRCMKEHHKKAHHKTIASRLPAQGGVHENGELPRALLVLAKYGYTTEAQSVADKAWGK